MTDAEKKLWSKLRNRQLANLKFRRQIAKGPYFLDFCCPEKNLVIEVNGGQHYAEEGQSCDRTCDKYLKQFGLKVVRYSNRDVLSDLDSVLKDILNKVEKL
jgi:very-short-patch-repair endonuclease